MSSEISPPRVLAELDKILQAVSRIQLELARASLISPPAGPVPIGRVSLRSSAPPPSKPPPRRWRVGWTDPATFTRRSLVFVAASADDARLMAAPSLGLSHWDLTVEPIDPLEPTPPSKR